MNVISYQPQQAQPANKTFLETPFAGMYYRPLKIFNDKRGYFTEMGRMHEIETLTSQPFQVAQLNLSSSHTNIARGFHAEGWNKLVTVTAGTALCAWADIRPKASTFGQVFSLVMGDSDEASFGSMYIPQGIANSFLVLQGPVLYSYAVDRLYTDRNPNNDVAISLFDPDLGMNWPIDRDKMIISQRDADSVSLREKFPQQFE